MRLAHRTSPPPHGFATRPCPAGCDEASVPPPIIAHVPIPDPCASNQTGPPPPYSSQGSRAPRSAARGSSPATPAGPRPRDPPRPIPLPSSTRVGHLPTDGASAVPLLVRPRSRSALGPKPHGMAHLGRVRTVGGARCLLRGCRRLETPRNEKETLRKGGTRFPSPWLRLPAGVNGIARVASTHDGGGPGRVFGPAQAGYTKPVGHRRAARYVRHAASVANRCSSSWSDLG